MPIWLHQNEVWELIEPNHNPKKNRTKEDLPF
jgi:hypothetical protein